MNSPVLLFDDVSVVTDNEATGVLNRLRAAQASGSLTDRDNAAIDALRVLSGDIHSLADRAALAIAASRALRQRWNETLVREHLDSALAAISHAESLLAGDPAWSAVAAEFARVLADYWVAFDSGSFVLPREPTADELPFLKASAADTGASAMRMARAALAAARDPATEADAALTLGDLQRGQGDWAGACHWISRAVELAPTVEARLRLALTLAERFDAIGSPPNRAEIYQQFDAVATDPSADPRHAFQADRLAAMFAAAHSDWAAAAARAGRALACGERLRLVQAGEAGQRQWTREAGTLASLAAISLVNDGRTQDAVESLEAALATEFSDRISADTGTVHRTYRDIANVAAEEPLIYLVTAPSGYPGITLVGQAIVVGAGRAQVVSLPELNSHAVYSVLYEYSGRYAEWKRGLGADSLSRLRKSVTAVLEWLGSAVLGPIIKELPQTVNAVTIIADGLIGMLPLGAATFGGVNALDRLRVRCAPNAFALGAARGRLGAHSAGNLLVAVSTLADQPPLPYAATEIDCAAALLADSPPTTKLVDAQADADTITRILPTVGMAHFACHGMNRFDDPTLSSLYLGDGSNLAVEQMLRTDFTGIRLAILSACESGIPEIDVPYEKLSMPTALLLAGVSGVIASLWAVDDRSTMLLMTRVHELLRSNQEPCAALRSAQIWLRDTPTSEIRAWALHHTEHVQDAVAEIGGRADYFANPYYWAGFSYFGA